MITETTRRCSSCPELLDGATKVCPKCGREQAPAIADWPVGSKRFLCMLIVVDAVHTRINLTEQQQYEWLLENALRGRWYADGLVPYSATAASCYPRFIEIYRRWQEAGQPTDFTAIAAIRGSRP